MSNIFVQVCNIDEVVQKAKLSAEINLQPLHFLNMSPFILDIITVIGSIVIGGIIAGVCIIFLILFYLQLTTFTGSSSSLQNRGKEKSSQPSNKMQPPAPIFIYSSPCHQEHAPPYSYAFNVHKVVEHGDIDRILLETDAPYFLPSGARKNSMNCSFPGHVIYVAAKIAKLKKMTLEQVLIKNILNSKLIYKRFFEQ